MKKILTVLVILAVLVSSVYATRISITYNDADYILNTSKKITADNVAYFNGMYDAFVCVKEGRLLYEIQAVIASKTFTDDKGNIDEEQKLEYEFAFADFMENYTYGANGEFADVYPLYASLMVATPSYRNAKLLVEFGGCRFYIKNL